MNQLLIQSMLPAATMSVQLPDSVRIPTIQCGMLVRTEQTVQGICNHDPASMSSYLPVVSRKTARSGLHSL
jgi:hypothetical protein